MGPDQKRDAFYVEARVRGSSNYLVTLSLVENQLAVFCDCPCYESSGPCKHIWATILEADKRGYYQEAERFGAIEVVELSTDDEFYEDGMDDDDIGQTQRVFTYRIISRDTVEEKVLELQKTKRDLADAIINADNKPGPEFGTPGPGITAVLIGSCTQRRSFIR